MKIDVTRSESPDAIIDPSKVDEPKARKDLRRKAEAIFHEQSALLPEDRKVFPPENLLQVLQELRIHQIELEMQNEELRQSQAALDTSRERYFDLYDLAPVGYCTVSASALNSLNSLNSGLIVEANLTLAKLLGVARSALVRQPFSRFIYTEDADSFYLLCKQLIAGGEPQTVDLRMLRHDGKPIWVHLEATAAHDDGEPVLRIVVADISKRKQAEEKLQLAASVFTHAREGILITAADGTIIEVNDTFTRITGYSPEEAIGQNPRFLKSGHHDPAFYVALWRDLTEQGYWYGEVWNRRKNGEVFAEMLTISAVCDSHGQPRQYVALFSDISALKAHEKQLEHLAHYDALTSLPNRVLLADRMRQAMSQARRRQQSLAVAYIDLDGFKRINDRYGHDIGDQLLVEVSERMKQGLREGDTLARLGGDEFVAVLLDLADIEASVPMLSRLLAAAAEPVHVGELVLQISASLGVTFYPQAEDTDADQLLRKADQAMYQAKLSGKNRFHVFDAELDRSVRAHHESLQGIRQALAAQEFVLYYQPKVSMRSGTVIGAEALIRWQHPENGLLQPALFLPVIEDNPLAIKVGEWAIDNALSQIEHWQAAGFNIPVSVNVSAFHLQQADFTHRLRHILATHPKIVPGDLELEILETSALENLTGASQVIKDCLELGVKFALDDFGTGYSSLNYLKRLPVTQIKIDQSFVRDMTGNPDDLAILEGLLGLATTFRRQVIVEGVETSEQGDMLLHLGCDLAQGYGISRPMPANDLPAWAAAWRSDPVWAE